MNKYLISAALGAVLALGGASAASAQQRAAASSAPVVAGIGWANIEAAEAATTAFKTAESQRPVTYKAQIDQAEARSQALNAQVTRQQKRQEQMEDRLTAFRTRLLKQYTSLDKTMSELTAQNAYVTQQMKMLANQTSKK